MRAREVKKRLQSQHDRGVFATRQALFDFGQERGWELYRNTFKYVSFQFEGWVGKRKRVRVKVDFDDEDVFLNIKALEKQKRLLATPYRKKAYFAEEPHSLAGYDIRWIYVIFARDGDEYCAYVGQASRMSSRLKGHLGSKRLSKSSGPLKLWAAARGVELHFAVVDVVWGDLGKGPATSKAAYLEGFWTERARKNNVALPGVEGWGQFPQQPDDPNYREGWGEVLARAQPMSRIIANEYRFDEICLNAIAFDEIRDQYERQWQKIQSAPIANQDTVQSP